MTGWQRAGPDWIVTGPDGEITRGTHLILASGLHLKTALPELGLRASRGQLSWADTGITRPVTYGGYAIPAGGRTLLGATHDRLVDADPFRLEPADDLRNAAQLREYLGVAATDLTSARASVRVNSADTLPLLDARGEDLWVLGALGSRGFSHAPLLGANLASALLGLPRPLTGTVSARLCASRGRA